MSFFIKPNLSYNFIFIIQRNVVPYVVLSNNTTYGIVKYANEIKLP
jgi:hypothetical protein